MQLPAALDGEWLETDGLGGYAMGTPSGLRLRRYHGLLVSALAPPTRRVVLLADLEVWLETPAGPVFLSTHRYAPDVVYPEGARLIDTFSHDPWPRWTFRLADDTRIVHDVLMSKGTPRVALAWRVVGALKRLTLCVRPLLAFRDHHALGRERPLSLRGEVQGARVSFRPEPQLPALVALANGAYGDSPEWYRNFVYDEERARGFDGIEDLASPGVFRFDLLGQEAALVFATGGVGLDHDSAPGLVARLKLDEAKRRSRFSMPLARAADSYLVRRGEGLSVIAGYPWFGDWGRDTFVALRGLCLAQGRYDEARRILDTWIGAIDGGMVPNRFTDDGQGADYNSADASLWFVVAAGALLERLRLPAPERQRLVEAIGSVLEAYQRGARYGIRADSDGLLSCGEAGVQLTWMDAKLDGWVVTPRVGKPVEVQALWVNALAVGARAWQRYEEPLARARAAFERRFWFVEGGYLYDVIDCDHVAGRVDARFRPNQLWAVGGLPQALVTGPRAHHLMELAEAKLWTPAGPRSLAPNEPGYCPRYVGGPRERDSAYHQGTVWPYLVGPFVEAWLRAHGDSAAARREARSRFLTPLLVLLDPSSSGHLPEIADAEPPHTPRGCPFQAWSVAEALRLDLEVLAPTH